jgi:hypothetical protein
MRVLFLLTCLLLSACGGREPRQQTAAPSKPGSPASPAVSAMPANHGVPGQSAPTVAEQTPSPAHQPAPAVPPEQSSQAVQSQPARPSPYSQPAPTPIRIPSGTVWRVRLDETLDTRHNRPGDRFSATLISPVTVDGTVVVPRGAHCYGHLAESRPSGRLKGRALMSISLDAFDLNGKRYAIETSGVSRQSGRHRKRNLLLIGGGSGVGAAIGAITAGPAGALIGAGAGGGAGLTGAAITGKKNIRLPVETVLTFSQRVPLSL